MQHATPPTLHPSPSCSLFCNWWTFALRGMAAVVFGGLAMMLPAATVTLVTLVFGAYALVDGAFALVAGVRRSTGGRPWGAMVAAGLIGLALGAFALGWPSSAGLGLSAFLWAWFAAWSACAGMLDLATSFRLRRMVEGEWLLRVRGALSLALGLALVVLMWRNPVASVVSLGWLVGFGSILSGLTHLAFAFRLRRLDQESTPRVA